MNQRINSGTKPEFFITGAFYFSAICGHVIAMKVSYRHFISSVHVFILSFKSVIVWYGGEHLIYHASKPAGTSRLNKSSNLIGLPLVSLQNAFAAAVYFLLRHSDTLLSPAVDSYLEVLQPSQLPIGPWAGRGGDGVSFSATVASEYRDQ